MIKEKVIYLPNWVKRFEDKEEAKRLRNIYRKRNYAKTQGYPKRQWTIKEMDLILYSDKSDAELARMLKRSVQSIQIKRSRIKKKVEV